MFRRLIPLLLLCVLFIALIPPAFAQAPPERVEVEASDGLALVGHYYAPQNPGGEGGARAVLLMHHGGAQKEVWYDLVPVLLDAGYAAVTIDIRSHGETGGKQDWALAEEDVHVWLAWLRAQDGINPDKVSIVGASLGTDLGLRAMADDPQLVTLVGISPLLDAYDVILTAPAVEQIERPLFLIAGQGVEGEADAARRLMQVAQGDIQVRLYDSNACCTYFFMLERDLIPAIMAWLDYYNR
jgi:alpha-beta hydrolase superfamily lysophospholipase